MLTKAPEVKQLLALLCGLYLFTIREAFDHGDNRGFLEFVQLPQPQGGRGVGGHPPVASRREGHAADSGTVGQAVALELLVKETTDKGDQPALDYRRVKLSGKAQAGQSIYFFGRIAEA